MKVFKFGGASVKDAKGVKNLASIVSKSEGQLVIVISAMGKITNALEELIKLYFKKDERKWELMDQIKKYNNKIIKISKSRLNWQRDCDGKEYRQVCCIHAQYSMVGK